MSLNLTKGGSLNLTKAAPSLKEIMLGAGWDVAAGGPAIDLDLMVFLLNANGKVRGDDDVVYFGNLKNANQSVLHSGDNRTGAGEGDDETITLHLDKVDTEIKKIAVVLTFYNAGSRDLGMVSNAFTRVVNMEEKDATGKPVELAKYEIKSDIHGKTIYFAEFASEADGWNFHALGECSADDFQSGAVAAKYGA